MNTIEKSTNERIAELLKMPIGKSFLDSGGHYGYRYEKNQNVDFDSEERVSFDIYGTDEKYLDFSVSLYHYLSETLETDEFCRNANEVLREKEIHWTGELDELIESEEYPFDGCELIGGDNTYNFENYGHFSQVFQYTKFKRDGDEYIGIQIHGGCDVRGGYTPVEVFKLDYFADSFPFVNVYGEIDGIQVDTMYNGYSLTDESGNEVPIKSDSKIDLDFMK